MKIKIVLNLLIFILISGCSNPQSLIPTAFPSETPSRQIENTVTLAAATNTFIPSNTMLPSGTPTETSLPTWTPLPTLENDQADAQMLEWLQGSPECRLPCWAGITPGVTTWQEAKQILGEVVNFDAVYENTSCTFGPCNDIQWSSRTNPELHGYIYSRSDNLIKRIILEGSPATPVIRLDRILTQYGPPVKMFLESKCPVLDANNVYFALILGYPKNQFILDYHLKAILSGENIVASIQAEYFFLSINLINGEWTDDAIKKEIHGNEDIPPKFFQPLEKVTDMTIQKFYENFRNYDASKYIVTPCRNWMP
jgi:hypothetical protein